MCAAPNLANLSSYSIEKPTISNSNEHSLFPHKISNRMFIFSVNKQEKHCFDSDLQLKYAFSQQALTPEKDVFNKERLLMPVGFNPEDESQVTFNNVQKLNIPFDFAQGKLRPYRCTECAKTFIQKHHLTAHIKVHSGVKPHVCNQCGKAFTHKHCLNTHLLLHSSERPYQCMECKKNFTLKHHLISHAKVHSREKPFICTDCGCAFPLKRHLVTHSKFHAGERPFVCKECGESFSQEEHLVMHSRFHGSVNSYVCHECNATFTRKFELVNHNRLHGHIPFNCPICDKEFLQKRTLIVHMRAHTGETKHSCQTCGEAFQLQSELMLHMNIHKTDLTDNESGLSCAQCGSSFNNPEALTLHVKLHSGDASLVNDLRTLTANLQSTNFKNQPDQRKIETSFSPTVKMKPHVCKFCSRAFSSKHGLQQHNRRHPEGTCTLKSHICETCNKAFYQKNHLLLHQRQHSENYSNTNVKHQVGYKEYENSQKVFPVVQSRFFASSCSKETFRGIDEKVHIPEDVSDNISNVKNENSYPIVE